MNQPDPDHLEPTLLLADEDRFGALAEAMVRRQLCPRRISDRRVLGQMRRTPRHRFVDPDLARRAYDDIALPSRDGQTISQPYIVARMTEMLSLEPGHRVLEVGTGTGYQTMILAGLCRHVVSIERNEPLSARASRALRSLGVANTSLRIGDGSLGCAGDGPFDRILVTAAAPHAPAALCDQLADRGRMVIPIGDRASQRLVAIDRNGDALTSRRGEAVRFVPLLGEQGF